MRNSTSVLAAVATINSFSFSINSSFNLATCTEASASFSSPNIRCIFISSIVSLFFVYKTL